MAPSAPAAYTPMSCSPDINGEDSLNLGAGAPIHLDEPSMVLVLLDAAVFQPSPLRNREPVRESAEDVTKKVTKALAVRSATEGEAREDATSASLAISTLNAHHCSTRALEIHSIALVWKIVCHKYSDDLEDSITQDAGVVDFSMQNFPAGFRTRFHTIYTEGSVSASGSNLSVASATLFLASHTSDGVELRECRLHLGIGFDGLKEFPFPMEAKCAAQDFKGRLCFRGCLS